MSVSLIALWIRLLWFWTSPLLLSCFGVEISACVYDSYGRYLCKDIMMGELCKSELMTSACCTEVIETSTNKFGCFMHYSEFFNPQPSFFVQDFAGILSREGPCKIWIRRALFKYSRSKRISMFTTTTIKMLSWEFKEQLKKAFLSFGIPRDLNLFFSCSDIYRARSIAAFQTTVYGKYWLREIFKFLLHVPVALDQRKQKYSEFLKFLF